MLIFEKSCKNRKASSHFPVEEDIPLAIPDNFIRTKLPQLPEVSELDVVRHYTKLSQKNFSIDSNFYPLGSCTMKYNPRGAHKIASLPDFLARHPLSLLSQSQGYMQCVYELQNMLAEITGMQGVSLCPMAGAQGELAGVLMIKAYHQQNGEADRCEILVPDSAHGTNPASAVMCGYQVKEIPTNKQGELDLEVLKKKVNSKTAGLMLTNPSTLGIFERQINYISQIVHDAGGLLYYDGANLNAIIGRVRPGDMGFDVMHMNLHKTFATPHGGGGPGCGPVAVNEKLLPFLPIPMVGLQNNQYVWLGREDYPHTIGHLSTFMGNAGIILRALIYIKLLGDQGLREVSAIAVLNSNYLMRKLQNLGFSVVFPDRIAAHEFIIEFKTQAQAKQENLTALDFAKRLLDEQIHAPTVYFPLSVPECWLIEPTETESKETLDQFIDVMHKILREAKEKPATIRNAPAQLPVSRLDEVKAARDVNIIWEQA